LQTFSIGTAVGACNTQATFATWNHREFEFLAYGTFRSQALGKTRRMVFRPPAMMRHIESNVAGRKPLVPLLRLSWESGQTVGRAGVDQPSQ
jgi:hypothetical protein